MAPTRKIQVLLILISLLSIFASAQGGAPALPNLSTITAEPGATSDASSSTGKGSSSTGSDSSSGSSSSGSSSSNSASTGSSTSQSDSSSLPNLSSSSSSSSSTGPALPTLAGVGVPPLIVPDTSGAPFMQKSNLPEGTVFIAVGAILGFLGMCVLAWRGLVAWSLQRSVRKAAHTTYASTAKSTLGLGSNNGYSSVYASKNISMEHLSNPNTSYGGNAQPHKRSSNLVDGREKKAKGDRQDRQSRAPTTSSLFFSPTAGGGSSAQTPGERSSYMPSGYYPSGAQTQSGGYGRVSSIGDGFVSPPDSPGLRPSRPTSQLRPTSSIDLLSGGTPSREQVQRRSRLGPDAAAPPQGRAPSAYLEDLFDSTSHSRQGSRDRR